MNGAPELLRLEELEVEPDRPAFKDGELRALEAIELLTAGVEGAWASARSVWATLRATGDIGPSRAALRSLTESGFLIVGWCSWHDDDRSLRRSKRRMTLDRQLLAMTRECRIEFFSQRADREARRP